MSRQLFTLWEKSDQKDKISEEEYYRQIVESRFMKRKKILSDKKRNETFLRSM
jgi:hypothetical protein